jgi:hypothetical protein
VAAAPLPEVFTLVPRDARQLLSPEELRWLRRSPHDPAARPPPARPRPTGPVLVLRRWPDGRVTVDDFPEEADVCEPLVAWLAPRLAGAVRLERGRLYVTAANGAAVYVPVGASARPGCTRVGRLYLRLADA